jgi:hypothetical protein
MGLELEEQPGETCEGCRVPVTVNCQSCGMPMTGPESYGGGNTDNNYCVHCCHPDGRLKDYSDVLEGMVGLMMKMRGLDRAAAASAAREYLATMPAWSGR